MLDVEMPGREMHDARLRAVCTMPGEVNGMDGVRNGADMDMDMYMYMARS